MNAREARKWRVGDRPINGIDDDKSIGRSGDDRHRRWDECTIRIAVIGEYGDDDRCCNGGRGSIIDRDRWQEDSDRHRGGVTEWTEGRWSEITDLVGQDISRAREARIGRIGD